MSRLKVVLCAALLVTAACGDKDDKTNDDSDRAAPLHGAYAALCAYLDRCSDQGGKGFPTSADCTDFVEGIFACNPERAVPVMSPSELEACIDLLGTTACDGTESLEGSACAKLMLQDEAGLGESCQELQCGKGLYCDFGEGDTCPVCHTRPGLGEECDFECADGAYCDVSGHCAALLATGETCTRDSACESEWCDGTGHCKEPLAGGAACDEETDKCAGEFRSCRGGHCADRADVYGMACEADDDCQEDLMYCDGTGHCAAWALCQPPAVGERCIVSCVSGAFCDLVTEDPAICSAIVALGQPCDNFFQCGPAAFCDLDADDSVCVTLLAAGTDCSFDLQCADGLFCDASGETSVCAALLVNGSACTDDEACQSDNCADGFCADENACVMP